MSKEHQARYLRFKADEASQAITGPYRQLNPEDNNERQSIHEHTSVPLPILNERARQTSERKRQRDSRDPPSDARSQEKIHHGVTLRLRSGQAPTRRRSRFFYSGFPPCLCVSVVIVAFALVTASSCAGAHHLPRHHCPGRHPLHSQQRSLRKKVASGNHGPRLRVHRLRQRRLARHPACQRSRLARPRQKRRDHAEALPQQSRRHLHRRDSQVGPRHFAFWDGRCRRRLRQRRLRRHFHHRRRPEPSLPQQRQRHVSPT